MTKIPTSIVDKNGKTTTVHKNPEQPAAVRPIPVPATNVPDTTELGRNLLLDIIDSRGRIDEAKNANLLKSELLDPYSRDDSQFGTDFVYCGSHVNVHSTGWCSVSIGNKIPIGVAKVDDDSLDAARDEARSLGLRISGDT